MAHGLTFHRLADKRSERIPWRDRSGVTHLINPENGKREPYPSLGIMLLEKLSVASIGTKVVDEMIGRGELTVEGETVKTVPAGPPSNPYAKTHVFRHFTYMTFHTAEGDVRYKVTRSPDKVSVTDPVTKKPGFEIVWTYDLELVSE